MIPFVKVIFFFRDAPEATGEEPDDADFDMPKIYEPVSWKLLSLIANEPMAHE